MNLQRRKWNKISYLDGRWTPIASVYLAGQFLARGKLLSLLLLLLFEK